MNNKFNLNLGMGLHMAPEQVLPSGVANLDGYGDNDSIINRDLIAGIILGISFSCLYRYFTKRGK